MDRIDDFYDEKLTGLGFSVLYAQRKPATLLSPQPHTIAIAYRTSDWVLID